LCVSVEEADSRKEENTVTLDIGKQCQ